MEGAALPPPVGGDDDVRATDVFTQSVPVDAVPPDRRRAAGAADSRGTRGGARPPAEQRRAHGSGAAARQPAAVRPQVAAAGGALSSTAVAQADEWQTAQLSFSRVDPVGAPAAPTTSALAAMIESDAAQPRRLQQLGPRSVGPAAISANHDNLNLQVTVDVSSETQAFQKKQLSVFSRCTVDQVIAMVLRQCKAADTETSWGSDHDYELYVVDNPDEPGGTAVVNPDMPPLQGSQKIGSYRGQLSFALVRAFDAREAATPRPPGGSEEDEPRAGSTGGAPEPEPQALQPPPPVVVQHLKSAAEELLQNVGTQNVCKQCSERIDFVQVSPDKIGELKKQMDHTGLWKDRWFQLYGNHLVYWNDAKEDLDLASGRGVIHLDSSVTILPGGARCAPPPVDTASAGTAAATHTGSGVGRSSQERGTIMAGSMTGSVMAGEAHAGRHLLSEVPDSLEDDSMGDGSSAQLLAGGSGGLGSSGVVMPLESPRGGAYVETSEDTSGNPRALSTTFSSLGLPGTTAADLETEFTIELPHKTYKFRALTRQERDAWVTALQRSARMLFHTCLFCWKNVDPRSSGLEVVCRGYLHIQLNAKMAKQWDKRWMVCTTNKQEGSTHVVYYNDKSHEGQRPAQGCIHLCAIFPSRLPPAWPVVWPDLCATEHSSLDCCAPFLSVGGGDTGTKARIVCQCTHQNLSGERTHPQV